jgi:S-methyl-5-thioribose-1-phosphate isomerase
VSIHSFIHTGAPLIAIVAVLGLAVDLTHKAETLSKLKSSSPEDILSMIEAKMEYLRNSRPTAVNLSNALEEVKQVLAKVQASSDTTTPKEQWATVLPKEILTYAEFMLERDVSDNTAIGRFGAEAILKETGKEKVNMVTICNTGSLATAGFGTALGVIRALAAKDALESITALETRPYNQGSRLTAFEIMDEQMPGGQLICDSAVGALMNTKTVDAVVVGADRVCANGDTANKIGTYNLSIVAAYHKVPFYVAAPITSLDISLDSGADIPIEERPANELIETSKAPANMKCWNPAFDVTPACNIRGIITEKGVIEPDGEGKIDVKAFV